MKMKNSLTMLRLIEYNYKLNEIQTERDSLTHQRNAIL